MRRPAALALTLVSGLFGAGILAPPFLPVSPSVSAALAPYNSELQTEAARQAIIGQSVGSIPVAGRYALNSLAAMPFNQPALALAIQAESATDEIRATNLSAALGWRDPLANLRLISKGLSEHSPRIAAQRVDALGRTQGGQFAARAADRLMAMPGGPRELASRAANRTGGQWWITYLRLPAITESAENGRLAFARAIESDDGPWRRRIVAAISGSLKTDRQAERSFQLWQDTLAESDGRGPVLYDGDFSRFSSDRAGLGGEWRLSPGSPFDVSRAGESLVLSARSKRGGTILEQRFLPDPGMYRFVSAGNVNSAPLSWRIRCRGLRPLLASSTLAGDWRVEIPTSCKVATLQLVASDGAGPGTQAKLYRVALERQK